MGSGSARSIAAALASAPDGASIVIAAGIYNEQLVVDRPVTLTAENGRGTVVLEWQTGAAITCTAQAAISGLTIRSTGTADSAAVRVERGALILEHCDVESADWGVNVMSGSTAVVSKSRFTRGTVGVAVMSGRGWIEDCDFVDMATNGIAFYGSQEASAQGCTIRGCGGHGVKLAEGAVCTIENCDIAETSQAAVYIGDRANPTIRNCRIHDGNERGVLSTGRSSGVVESCVIEDMASSGVHVEHSANPTFRDTEIRGCRGNGIYVSDYGRGRFESCTIGATRLAGLGVKTFGNPTMVGGSIAGGEEHGVHLLENGRATLDRVEVRDVRFQAFRVEGNGHLTATDVKTSGAGDCAIWVREHSSADFTRLDVRATTRSAAIVDGQASFDTCTLLDCTEHGVNLRNGGAKVTMRDTELAEMGQDGVWVQTSNVFEATGSRFRHCNGAGIRIGEGGRAVIERCHVEDNKGPGIAVESSAPVVVSGGVVRRNSGVSIEGGNRPSVRIEGVDVGERQHATTSGAAAPSTRAQGRAERTKDDLLAELANLTGLVSVKHEVTSLVNKIAVHERRRAAGLPVPTMSRHLVFTGAPGTGKTTVARLYGEILASLGVLRTGQVVEVSRSDLVSENVGGTALKTTAKFNEAIGGVFFIDEAYALAPQPGASVDFGREAIDTLVKLMEDHREDIVVIAAGYSAEMRTFLRSNTGLASRFSRTVEFPDYSPQELIEIVERQADEHGYLLAADAREALVRHFQAMKRDASFGNGRVARTVFEEMSDRQSQRLASMPDATADDLRLLTLADIGDIDSRPGMRASSEARDQDQVGVLLAELDGMVGLPRAKEEVTDMVNLLTMARRRKAAGLPELDLSRHLIFAGPPGTGKTTIARLYGRLLSALGVLSTGQTVEVSRSDLVAQYVGQTAPKTREAFDRARGGVLFVDEAHALSQGRGGNHDFGQEAIDTLAKLMEDHRDEVVVIAAGFPDEMRQFCAANPGLASRFSRTVVFDGYGPDELTTIFVSMAAASGFDCPPDTIDLVREQFDAAVRDSTFGNAREARRILNQMISRQARRLSTRPDAGMEELRLLLPEDVPR